VDGSVLVSRQMNLNVDQALAQVNETEQHPRRLLWTAVSHRLLFLRKTCQINLSQKARRQVGLALLVCSLSQSLIDLVSRSEMATFSIGFPPLRLQFSRETLLSKYTNSHVRKI